MGWRFHNAFEKQVAAVTFCRLPVAYLPGTSVTHSVSRTGVGSSRRVGARYRLRSDLPRREQRLSSGTLTNGRGDRVGAMISETSRQWWEHRTGYRCWLPLKGTPAPLFAEDSLAPSARLDNPSTPGRCKLAYVTHGHGPSSSGRKARPESLPYSPIRLGQRGRAASIVTWHAPPSARDRWNARRLTREITLSGWVRSASMFNLPHRCWPRLG